MASSLAAALQWPKTHDPHLTSLMTKGIIEPHAFIQNLILYQNKFVEWVLATNDQKMGLLSLLQVSR